MVFEDGYADSPEFSFLVVGDSGSGHDTALNDDQRNKWYNTAIAVHVTYGRRNLSCYSSEFYYENFVNLSRIFW